MSAERFRLVVAEDDLRQRRSVTEALAASGRFDTRVHPDGRAALEDLRARSYDADLLLTDIVMPRLDGPGLLQRALSEAPALPAVVLSGDREGPMIIECLRLGASDYLFKPCVGEVLVKKLLDVLERRGRFGPVRPPRVETDADGWVTLTAPTGLEYIARFRDFSERLCFTGLPPEERETMRFVIDELGRNAVEWGNNFDVDKKLRLGYRLFPDRLEIRISDEGRGFAVNEWRDPADDLPGHVQRRMAEGKRPGGFGIALARKLMDEVVYNEAGNEVIATKRFTPPQAPPAPAAVPASAGR